MLADGLRTGPAGAAATVALPSVDDGWPAERTEILRWLASITARHPMRVERVPFDALADWRLERRPLRLAHRSGKFFTIEGIRTATDHGPVREWDQPIINHPEIGILGILTRVIDGVRCGLMQAKLEPGNVNGAQISPTLQATRSNYTRVHRGRHPTYLEYFTGGAPARVLIDQLQSEQASRFLQKRNRNMVVEPLDDPPADDRFRWIPLAHVKRLLCLDNVVNMDARSVLSCIPASMFGAPAETPPAAFGAGRLEGPAAATARHSLSEIVNWISALRVRHDRRVVRCGLDRLRGWTVTPTHIGRDDGRYFSVVAADVEIGNREVTRWSQPLLYHHGQGLNGMITQRFNGVLHFLIRACLYPGSREIFELGATASRSDHLTEIRRPDAPPFLDLFASPDAGSVRFSSVQSEEGGRFLHYQNRYLILEVPPHTVREVPEPFMWMTLEQIEALLPHGYFNIEARNLLACLPLA